MQNWVGDPVSPTPREAARTPRARLLGSSSTPWSLWPNKPRRPTRGCSVSNWLCSTRAPPPWAPHWTIPRRGYVREKPRRRSSAPRYVGSAGNHRRPTPGCRGRGSGSHNLGEGDARSPRCRAFRRRVNPDVVFAPEAQEQLVDLHRYITNGKRNLLQRGRHSNAHVRVPPLARTGSSFPNLAQPPQTGGDRCRSSSNLHRTTRTPLSRQASLDGEP